jgi:hypothetical protein
MAARLTHTLFGLHPGWPIIGGMSAEDQTGFAFAIICKRKA